MDSIYMNKAMEAYKKNLANVREIMATDPNYMETLEKMVSISEGNTKTGKFPSVSLLPRLSCPWSRCKGTCGEKCYAIKLAKLRPVVMEAYARNTAVLKLCPVAYFRAVGNAIRRASFFRFHIAGDIPNKDYLYMMHYLAENNPSCTILCFTKQYEIVNDYLAHNVKPSNLQILFSGWTNLDPVNPYNLPETTVYKTEADKKPEWIACGGNCLDCAIHDGGCWKAQKGDIVAFKIH